MKFPANVTSSLGLWVFFPQTNDLNRTINTLKFSKTKETLAHLFLQARQVARSRNSTSKLTAECFVKYFTFNIKDEKQQSDKHPHLDCQLKGWRNLSRLANSILYISIHIYIVYVCLSTVLYIYTAVHNLTTFEFSDRCSWTIRYQYAHKNSTFSSNY